MKAMKSGDLTNIYFFMKLRCAWRGLQTTVNGLRLAQSLSKL
jgi:hypothetical protein